MADRNHLATTFYQDRSFNRSAVKLMPGEYFVTSEQKVLCTVLGSCVSACIRDPTLGLAGMNHFLLPVSNRAEDENSARYGIHAMEMLINGLLKQGARRGKLEVKLFGGGNLMKSRTLSNVGHENARFALSFMAREKLKVVSQDLFGDLPRKIWYFPDTGRVMLRRLSTTRNDTILRREVDFSRQLREEPQGGGEVVLFGSD